MSTDWYFVSKRLRRIGDKPPISDYRSSMTFIDDGDEPENLDEHDAVEQDIVIHASVEEVWTFVSEPGWWLNDGPMGDHDVSQDDDGIYHVSDPEAGEWLVEKADEDPMDLVAFRWYPLASDELPDELATRIEVSLSGDDGDVNLHVEESGLASISEDEAECERVWEDESGMWEDVLHAAKAYLEQ